MDKHLMYLIDIEHRAHQWFVNGEVGSSSRTFAGFCLTVHVDHPSRPYDDADRLRCVKLLELIPEWLPYLDSIPSAYPNWKEEIPLIKEMLAKRRELGLKNA